MIPMLAQVSVLPSPFELDIEKFAAAHCFNVEIWLTKLENYLSNGRSVESVRNLLAEHGVEVPVAALQGGLLTSQGDARRLAWTLFNERLSICAELGVKTMIVMGDISGPLSPQDLERVRISLFEAARQAAEKGIRIALEFQAGATFPNNLESAIALLRDVGHSNLGLCLDLFHFHVGPSKFADLELLTADNLFHVQLSDLSGVLREFANDADRIFPGEGEILLNPILDRMRQIGYLGGVSIELMNPQIWQVPAVQFGEVGMTSLRSVLGLADT